jgi:HEAT repeat protein
MAVIVQRWSAIPVLTVLGLAALVTTLGCAQQTDTAGLLQTAAGGTADARYAAIDDLGERHQAAESVVPELVKLLKDADPKVRWRSARSLGDYGELAQPAVAELRTLLHDNDLIVQYHAAAALGKTGDRSDESIDALVTAVTTPDGRVARAAIAALRNLNPDPKHVVAVLDELLSSDDPVVVSHAIEAAVERGAEAVPVLNEALKRPKTVYLACAAIEQIGPDAAGTVPALTELLGDTKHSHLVIQTLLALASIGPAAQSASPQIMPLLEHSTDATVPVAAAYALGSIGAADADAALRTALTKPDPLLQMVAAWSLAKIHPDDAQLKQQSVERLQAGLKSDDPAIQAAAEKGLKLLEPPATEATPE